VIYQDHDSKEIFNNFMRTYLNIIVLYYEKLPDRRKIVLQCINSRLRKQIKVTWKIIKNLTRKIQTSQHVSPTFKLDSVGQSPEQEAGALNNYFLNTNENLNLHIAKNKSPISLLKKYFLSEFPPMQIVPITVGEIRSIISSIISDN